MQWPHIQAWSIVDVGNFPVSADMAPYLVTVNGELWGGEKLPERTYKIGAPSEEVAGRAGLDLYVNEMNKPN